MDRIENKVESMNELLDNTGALGLFQLASFFGFLMDSIIVIFTIVMMVYAGMTPDWYCIINSSESLWEDIPFDVTAETQKDVNLTINTTLSSASMGDVSRSSSFRACSVNGTKCDAFQFLGSSRTAVSEWSLVCDMAWVMQVMTSLQMAGIFVGTSVSSQLGEYFGRKRIVYFSLLMCSIVELVARFSVSWKMFTVCKFCAGISVGILLTNTLPYHIELASQKWRPVLERFPGTPIGTCIFGGVAYLLDDWVALHLSNVVIIIPLLMGWFYFPESPRWLAVHDRIDEAEKAVETIARLNGKPVPTGTATVMSKIAREERSEKTSFTIRDLFSTYQLAKLSLIFCFISSCINIVFYGIIFEISNLAGNVFLNIVMVAALQIPLQLTITFTVNWFGRPGATVFYFLISITGAVCCLILSYDNIELSCKGEIITGLCIMSRASLLCAYNVVILLSFELYPIAISSLGSRFVNCFSFVGGILAPLLINLGNMARRSYAIITFLILTCTVLVLVVKEVGEVSLPDRDVATDEELSGSDLYLLKDNGHKDNQSINSRKD